MRSSSCGLAKISESLIVIFNRIRSATSIRQDMMAIRKPVSAVLKFIFIFTFALASIFRSSSSRVTATGRDRKLRLAGNTRQLLAVLGFSTFSFLRSTLNHFHYMIAKRVVFLI